MGDLRKADTKLAWQLQIEVQEQCSETVAAKRRVLLKLHGLDLAVTFDV